MKKNKIQRIFLDMDGVLADFEKGVSKELGIDITNNEHGHYIYDDNKEELTAKHLFRNLEPMSDMWKLLGFINNLDIHTEVLSAAGSINREIVVNDKIAWVKEHVHPHWITTCTFNGSQKSAFAHPKAVLIDDREKNINDWIDAGGIGILHTSAEGTISELSEILKNK
jgi:5'(3')-deoxyribonucleotidase